MKNKSLAYLVSITSFFSIFLFLGNNVREVNAIDTYSITSFTELPTDWELYSGCDTSNTSVSYSNNEMVIVNANTTSANLYYGSVYYVNIGKVYSDFTFEVTMKMTNPADNNRWFGIGYHTQEVGGKMMGYLMNYRYNGDSAFSAFNNSQSFKDGDRVNVSKPLSDGQYHTMKVTMTGNQASHYVDNTLIVSWDVNDRLTHMGGLVLSSGGFALFVNRSTVNIKSVNISGTTIDVSSLEKDETLATTYVDESLVNFPTVVCDVKNEEILNSFVDVETTPSNAILNIDENMNVIDENGGVLDSFINIFKNKLNKLIIPVVYIDTEAKANALIKFLSEELFIIDMAVMSNNPELVKMVKDIHYAVRGIIKYENESDLAEIVKTTNMNYANVAVIDEELATTKNVSYIQARFKTVWVSVNEEKDLNLYRAINSGAYGIIVEDYEYLYSLYGDYDSSARNRTPFNVAHRGIPTLCNENSVKGTEKSIELGATHVEIDAYLTTDNKVAIMHDGSIDRTSNGTGNVESYTLAELQEFQLDLKEPYEPIPSLEDILVPFKDSDAVLVLEIKSSKLEIVEAIRNVLLATDMMDKTVVISFNTGILAKMKEVLPEIPTANLNTASASSFVSVLYWMGLYNTGIDTGFVNVSKLTNMSYLRDRGIIGWYWTFEIETTLKNGISNGYVGLTNNVCDYFADKVKYINGVSFKLEEGETINSVDLPINIEYYDGIVEEDIAELFYYEDKGDYYEVVAKYDCILGNTVATLYTQPYKIEKFVIDVDLEEPNDDLIDEEPNNNDNSALPFIIGGSAVVLIGLVTLVIFLIKREFSKK